MEQKSNHDPMSSPLDTWKSSDSQIKKSGAGATTAGYANAYQEQVSTFEGEGNPHSHLTVQPIKTFSRYADQGIVQAKRAAQIGAEWIKENPALAVGVGLCLGFLFGHQLKARTGTGDGARIL